MQIEIEGRLAVLNLVGPSQTVVLTEKLVAELAEAFGAAASDPGVEAIVFTSPEGSFLAGADVRYFARCLLSGELDRLLLFTRQGRGLFDAIQACPKRVVAWVRGPAVGAGLELALACHQILAGPKAKFSLPETGLGIYPGLGGTQRTPRRIGAGLAKWMMFTGSLVPAEHAVQFGLVDAVTNAATAEQAIVEATSPITELPPRFSTIEQFFAAHSVAAICDPNLPLPSDPQLSRAVAQVRTKSPLALRLAESIIDRGANLPLPQALDLEFSHLREVFSSEDARAGILSLGQQRVEFVGR